MGMSASQARLLSITARLSNTELQAQQIMNSKIRLASESEYINQQYLEALDQTKMQVNEYEKEGFVSKDVTYNQMVSFDKTGLNMPFMITDINGKAVVDTKTANAFTAANGNADAFIAAVGGAEPNKSQTAYYAHLFNVMTEKGAIPIGDNEAKSADWLEDRLKAGMVFLNRYDSQKNEGKGGYVEEYWNSASFGISEVTDDKEMNKIKAKFDGDLLNLQSQEKKLDLDLRKIDTVHNALQTEYDAAKKVIEKNIDRSFKTFNG